MVIVAMSMENAVDLVGAYPERGQRVADVGCGIDQEDTPLEDEDAAHRWPVHVPTVAIPGVPDREVVALEQVFVKSISTFVAFAPREVEVDLDLFLPAGDFKDVRAQPPHEYAVAEFHAFTLHMNRLNQFLAGPDAPEGKCELHPHEFVRLRRRDARFHQLLARGEPIVAAEDIGHLRIHLAARTDEQGP